MPRQHSPPPIEAFPHVPQSPFVPLVETARTPWGCTSQSPALPVPTSRRVLPPEASTLVPHQSFQPSPTPSHAFPPELPSVTSRPASARQPSASFVVSPHKVALPESSALASARLMQPPPPSPCSCPHVQEQVVVMPFNLAPSVGALSLKQHALLVDKPHSLPLPTQSNSIPSKPIQTPPLPLAPFVHAL